MRLAAWSGLVGLIALGCRGDPLPSVQGDHVELRTDVVEQVCAGTIASLDAEVERIEHELELGSTSPLILEVSSAAQMAEHCENDDEICVGSSPRRLHLAASVYARRARYELGRERLIAAFPDGTHPILLEGLATAISARACEPTEDWQPPPMNDVLRAYNRETLGSEGRYLGGELLRWLLDTRGPDQVRGLIGAVPRFTNYIEIRWTYQQQIGGSLDTDLVSHWRSDEVSVDPAQVGCVAPEPEFDASVSQLKFDATLDCDSPRVHNDFADPSRVYVEWTVVMAEDESSARLLNVPDGVAISLESCECSHGPWSSSFSPDPDPWWPIDDSRWLDAGHHRVRAYGPIGAEIEFGIQLDCDYAAQNCPPGQQCAVNDSCVDAVPDPAQLGEPCSPTWTVPRSCDVGLICIGPEYETGVCMQYCDTSDQFECPAELTCMPEVACASPCDPLDSDSPCIDDWACIPKFSADPPIGGCLPGPANLGLLEPCGFFDFSCAPGLACRDLEIEGCSDGWFSGCCTPTCDPAVADPGCPPELPSCVAYEGDLLGSCKPA